VSTPQTDLPPEPTALLPGEDRLFAEWELVLERLRTDHPALAGVLEGSSAVSRGDIILIKCGNPACGAFVRQEIHANSLKETIYQVTDRRVRLQIHKGGDAQPSKDPLAQLAERAKELE